MKTKIKILTIPVKVRFEYDSPESLKDSVATFKEMTKGLACHGFKSSFAVKGFGKALP